MKIIAKDHLTATERKYISKMIELKMTEAKINSMSLSIKDDGVYKLFKGNYGNGVKSKWARIATIQR